MKPGAELEDRRYPSATLDQAACRVERSREDLQQCALPRAVPADDAYDLAATDLEGHVAQRPKRSMALTPGDDGPKHVGGACIDLVHLRQCVDPDRRLSRWRLDRWSGQRGYGNHRTLAHAAVTRGSKPRPASRARGAPTPKEKHPKRCAIRPK